MLPVIARRQQLGCRSLTRTRLTAAHVTRPQGDVARLPLCFMLLHIAKLSREGTTCVWYAANFPVPPLQGMRRKDDPDAPGLQAALAAVHDALHPLAAAQAAADAASPPQPPQQRQPPAGDADLPPELRGQRHAALTVRGALQAAQAAAGAAVPAAADSTAQGAVQSPATEQQLVDAAAEAVCTEIAAAAVRQTVPALLAHLRAVLAALPPPAATHQQQQRQYQQQWQYSGQCGQAGQFPASPPYQRQLSGPMSPSGGGGGSGGPAASPPALVPFGGFDQAPPGASMELGDDPTGVKDSVRTHAGAVGVPRQPALLLLLLQPWSAPLPVSHSPGHTRFMRSTSVFNCSGCGASDHSEACHPLPGPQTPRNLPGF